MISNIGVNRVDFCVGYFNLRGWDFICDEVENLDGDYVQEDDQVMPVHRVCRLLIGMQRQPQEILRELYSQLDTMPDGEFVQKQKRKIAQDFKNQLLIGLPTKKDEATLRRLSTQMKAGKVCVKLYLKELLHAKLYLAHRPIDKYNRVMAILGSSNLTYSGLTGNGELNAQIQDSGNAEKLDAWFNKRWNDRYCIDVTKELIDIIDQSWAADRMIPPYYIYLKTAYHLSKDARDGMKEFSLSPEFSRELFDFQQTAVKITARHLRNDKRKGAMIGDVVGLGKTITACAIAKIYETTFASSTLIICPANLQDMWKRYAAKYDLKVEIMSMSKPIDVDNARYYRLVIIDESHNLRNGMGGSRYRNIKQLIDHQDSSVLLLTATPYNKDFRDLENQLRLFIDDDQDLGIRPEAYIRKLGGERQFMLKHENVQNLRSISAFSKSDEVEDWNELMKLFLVRRTRTFIKQNYAKTDDKDGRKYLEFPNGERSYFPERLPRAEKFKTEPGDQYSRLYSPDMIELMESLSLPRYGLSQYVNEKTLEEASKYEKGIVEDLSRAGKRMMGFAKSTFFKRIDSSGFSFLLTLYRHILRNAVFIYALDNKLKLPIGDENSLPDAYLEDQDINSSLIEGDGPAVSDNGQELVIPTDLKHYTSIAEQHYNFIASKGNVGWIDNRYFKRTLKTKLKEDCQILIEMIRLCGNWNPQTDQKLRKLEELIRNVHPKEKIVVFTQYSDTANYLFRQLKKRGMDDIAVVTGDSENPTAIVERFSPNSNDKNGMPASQQYRVIIATDVLSEGQNLQDSHIIVNFDLPWAIIRLIQRAGRVDRIGQESKQIFCYSFFPAEGVEKIISLRERLNNRINENAHIVGSDEIFFEGNEQNLRDMFNEKSGVLDEEEDNDVDLSSQAYQIWINAIKANPKLANIIPSLGNIIYSTKAATSPIDEGVVTYAQTEKEYDVLTWLDKEGNIISQSQKRILNAMSCNIETPAIDALDNHLELVGQAVKKIEEESVDRSMSGALGRRFSTRRQIIELLEKFSRQEDNLFVQPDYKAEIDQAINDIYNHGLLSTAKLSLGQMLRRRHDDADIVDYVISLRKEGSLCRIPEDDAIHKEPTIICSLGLRYNND